MLTNLFSMFDTSLYTFSPFFTMVIGLVMLSDRSIAYHKMINNKMLMTSTWGIMIMNQFYATMKSMKNFKKNIKNMSIEKFFLLTLLSVLFFNYYSLFPFTLSITSHMSFNMTFTLSMWTVSVCLALVNDMKSFFSHLTPMGTPMALMSFMVLIETVSSIIRPLTLAVRLMANMVAGHLLLTLLSKFSLISMYFGGYSSMFMIILTVLEMGVSFIQAYVLTLLCLLYVKEAFH